MSLQGSLDTVGLADVLTLLASTTKSGELEVSGDRRSGRLWFTEGKLNGFAVGKAPRPVDAVFELLRVTTGAFVFNDKRMAPSPQVPVAVDQVVTEAKARLSEWRTIEAVVPSLDARVELAPDPPAGVTLTREQWQLVVAIGDGRPVGAVLERRQQGEFDGCKAIKGMVDARLAKVISKPEPVSRPEPAVTRESTVARVSAAAGERPAPAAGERPAPKLGSLAAEVASVLGRPSADNGASPVKAAPAQPVPAADKAPGAGKAAEATTPGRDAPATGQVAPGDKAVAGNGAPAGDKAASGEKNTAGDKAASGDKAPAGGKDAVAAQVDDKAAATGRSPVVARPPLGRSDPQAAPSSAAGQPATAVKAEAGPNAETSLSHGNGSASSPAGKPAGEGPDAEHGAPNGEETAGEEDEPLNRGLLLKFLSSVRS